MTNNVIQAPLGRCPDCGGKPGISCNCGATQTEVPFSISDGYAHLKLPDQPTEGSMVAVVYVFNEWRLLR